MEKIYPGGGPDGEDLTEFELILLRISCGSGLTHEADRVGCAEGSLRAWILSPNHPERAEAYGKARMRKAEADEDQLKALAMEMTQSGFVNEDGTKQEWTRDTVAARGKALELLFNRQKFANRERFGDKQEVTHTMDISKALKDRLERAALEEKEKTRLEYQPGRVIDAEYSVTQPEPQTQNAKASGNGE